MDTENIIKSTILKLFNEGKSEAEVYKEISKSRSSNDVSEKIVNKWFEEYKSGNCSLNDNDTAYSKEKLIDKQIIDLINKNSDLSLEEIARLAKCSAYTIQDRISKLSNCGKSANYSEEENTEIADEHLIDLTNRNSNPIIEKLSKLDGCSNVAVHNKIIKLNSDGEKVNYSKKDNFKFSDEYLIELVDKNPDLSMSELAIIAGTSQVTISNRIKKIKSIVKSIRYTNKNNPNLRPNASISPSPKLTDEYIINLVNENPDLSMEKLAILANISHTTMWRRIKQINRDGEKAVYCKKDNKKFTDGYLINLVNENPDLSLAKLAVLTGTSATTIFDRIKQINRDGGKVNYLNKDNKKFTDEHSIDLVSSNSDFRMEKLTTQTDNSSNTIYNRVKKLYSGDVRTQYIDKGSGPKLAVKLTDEKLIYLINENPELNLSELENIVGISAPTISRKIKKLTNMKKE